MHLNRVEEIERAIQALTPDERTALYARIEESMDARIEKDLVAGRLDSLITQALDDERNGRTRPL